jgi:hypothetical protein
MTLQRDRWMQIGVDMGLLTFPLATGLEAIVQSVAMRGGWWVAIAITFFIVCTCEVEIIQLQIECLLCR